MKASSMFGNIIIMFGPTFGKLTRMSNDRSITLVPIALDSLASATYALSGLSDSKAVCSNSVLRTRRCRRQLPLAGGSAKGWRPASALQPPSNSPLPRAASILGLRIGDMQKALVSNA